MRFPPTLLATSLLLFATACSTSSPSGLAPSPALQAADAKVTAAEAELQDKLDHPTPPARLTLCQDGSTPQVIAGQWECPPPPAVVQAFLFGAPLEQRAALVGALRDETNLRFELAHWPPPAGQVAPASASPPSGR
jgi:hypothetical protein